MNEKREFIKTTIISIIFAAAAFAAVWSGLISEADKAAEDILYHHPDGTSAKIKIIKIDEQAMSELGDYENWDRGIYADLMEKLCVSDDVKPAVIGFDMLFGNDSGSNEDKRFAEACKKHGNVVCAFSYVFERELVSDDDGNVKVDSLSAVDTVKPYPALFDVTSHGFANALMDNDDGFIRSSFLYFPPEPSDNDTIEFSFNTEIYKEYAGINDFVPTFPYNMGKATYAFRYSGKSGDYENISISDVINGRVPAEAFDDCIVLVGAYAAGMMDAYYVPVDRSQQMYGVEIHANAVQALLEGKYIYSVPTWLSAAVAAIIVFALSFCCYNISVGKVVAICLSTAAVKTIAGYFIFSGIFTGIGYSGNVLITPIFSVIVMIYYTAVHYYRASSAKRKIERAFMKYVAPQVVKEIAGKGTYELYLGGEARDIAVLFVDIRGFTSLSENLEPKQIVEVLNSYFKLVTGCVFKYGGTLDKFIGDAAMAFFNAPFDSEDYIYKAVCTAMDIVKGGETLEKELQERFGKSIGFGVGVTCGSAVVGNIGCDFRMDYTAIGDTVNTAERLEANAPKGTVYISNDVYRHLKERITVDEVGEIPLKGKSKSVFVYSVTDIKTDETDPAGAELSVSE